MQFCLLSMPFGMDWAVSLSLVPHDGGIQRTLMLIVEIWQLRFADFNSNET